MENKKYTWLDAIEKALDKYPKGLTSGEIVDIISNKNLIPANTRTTDILKSVSGAISQNRNRSETPIICSTDNERYFLSKYWKYNAFGMKWDFEKSNGKLIGYVNKKSDSKNLHRQIGVYFLYDQNDNIIYVGQTNSSLIKRLKEHTRKPDELAGKWQKFSWFGWHPVYEDGTMEPTDNKKISAENMISYMEGVIIKCFKPQLLNKNTPRFNGLEFFQK